jgi:hypothetical protein
MRVTQQLAMVALAAAAAFAVVATIWLWRDMRERCRPVWLRVLVVVTGFVTGLGFAVWILDSRRHPHDPNLSRRDILLQRYER